MPDKKIPTHIAIIPDGNRRWAKERNLPFFEGHRIGSKTMKQSLGWFFSRGVKVLSFYAFSMENWSRSPEEVNFLMKLLKNIIDDEKIDAIKNGYKVIISGRIEELPGDMPEACYDIMDKTKAGLNGILNVCLNYGGRAEIVDAVKKILKNNIEIEQIHDGMIKKYLYNSELPDPDLIVRTSGEQRLSGFLLWESAYSEMIFLSKYWPDFEEQDAERIIEEYSQRKRRFGGN